MVALVGNPKHLKTGMHVGDKTFLSQIATSHPRKYMQMSVPTSLPKLRCSGELGIHMLQNVWSDVVGSGGPKNHGVGTEAALPRDIKRQKAYSHTHNRCIPTLVEYTTSRATKGTTPRTQGHKHPFGILISCIGYARGCSPLKTGSTPP